MWRGRVGARICASQQHARVGVVHWKRGWLLQQGLRGERQAPSRVLETARVAAGGPGYAQRLMTTAVSVQLH
eukprot:4694135-Prorocentrum_lima.AAC.1